MLTVATAAVIAAVFSACNDTGGQNSQQTPDTPVYSNEVQVVVLLGQSNAEGHTWSQYLPRTVGEEKAGEYAEGYDNVFIGTVEGEPEDTACDAVIEKVKEAGYTKVILRPLMVVAGDHANNDMAGSDEDSWLSQFNAAGCFDSVDTQIAGLGEIADVQALYVAHTKAAIDALNA